MAAQIKKSAENTLYARLSKKMKGLKPLITAVVHPVDEISLKGAISSAIDKIIEPLLIGPEAKIRKVAKECHLDLSPYEIIPTKHSEESAEKAVALVKSGNAEAIMKGKIHTTELMLPILEKITGLKTGRRMSHVFIIEVPYYHKLLFLTDAAINIFPKLSEKIDIVQNAIDLFVSLGYGTPKVAIVSAVETVNEKIPSTLDATALCKMAERKQITGGIVDGPLSFDLAVSKQAAKVKGIDSRVAGDADIIVVPDVESGNMLYKQMTCLSKMESAGIVMGAQVPIILTSRDSDELSRKASCALALLYARNSMKKHGQET